MKLHFPDGMGLTVSGVIRLRENGFVLEMPDLDLKTFRPIIHAFTLAAHSAATQAQIQAHVDQKVTLQGTWQVEGYEGDLPETGFLQVIDLKRQNLR